LAPRLADRAAAYLHSQPLRTARFEPPHGSVGQLLFAVATAAYILLGIFFEERDLMHYHGEEYRAYREQAPKLVPIDGGGKA
jgi:hypothetical protein